MQGNEGNGVSLWQGTNVRSGHLKAILIDQDSYLLELSRYVHLNPVRAKIVPMPEGYPYSEIVNWGQVFAWLLVEDLLGCCHVQAIKNSIPWRLVSFD